MTQHKEFLALTENGGKVGALMRTINWSKTSVGSFDQWPQSLKTSLSICLGSKFPMFVWWGRDLTVFYNDAYIPFTGMKHPEYFGRKASEQWAEIWEDLKPLTERVFNTGQATWAESMLLYMTRKGFLEETYFTFSYSPIRDESGSVGGIINPCQETTERILSERRLRTLRDLGNRELKSLDEIAQVSLDVLNSNNRDIPFALIYLTSPDGKSLKLAGSTGIKENSGAASQSHNLTDPSSWNFNTVNSTQKSQRVENLRSIFFDCLPDNPYEEKPDAAYVMPIETAGQHSITGYLVLGISPRLEFDELYQDFFGLVCKQLSIQISNVRAFEEERKRVEALAEIDKDKTAFFSNISHEFRTPLTLILGPLEEALFNQTLSSKDQYRLGLVYRNALRLQKLVNSLLDFSRVEAGRMQARYKQVDISKFTAEIANSFESAMQQAGLKYDIYCEKIDKEVYVDPDLWERILLNLISNALKFTFSGQISVRLSTFANQVQLQVEDSGIGISEKDLPKLFTRFHRVEGAKSRTYEGSGIGLALVSELVKLHHGQILVKSEVEKGTTITVRIPTGSAHLPQERVLKGKKTLPLKSQRTEAFVEEALQWTTELPIAEPSTTEIPSGNEALPRYRIVLADDNPDMRDYVYRILVQSQNNWDVLVATNGNEALQLIRKQPPDLILSDIMMPLMDGFGLLKAIRSDETLRVIPVIFLSARAGEQATIEGFEHKVDDYLIKPFSAKELIARVSTQLEMSSVRKEVAQLNQANVAKSQFLANMSHEIRTPLGAILGFAELMLDKDLSEDDKNDCLKTILRNGRQLTHVIDEILDLSKIESDRMDFEYIHFPLIEFVDETMTLLNLQAQEKGLVLNVVYDGPTPLPRHIGSDPGRLKQILLNVIGNAIKFTERGKVEVAIKYSEDTSLLEFTVTDSGIGMTAAQQKNIFQRFMQADNSMTRKYGGTGLGLIVSQKMARALGGDLILKESRPHQGSVFTLTIANRDVSPSKLSTDSEKKTSVLSKSFELQDAKILVVDDSPDNRVLVSHILKQAGASVSSAENGEEGVKAAMSGDYDIILMDLQMPVKDGFEATAELRRNHYQKPIIAFTAHNMKGDREHCLNNGFDEHLGKPVNKRLLVSVLASFIKPSRTQLSELNTH